MRPTQPLHEDIAVANAAALPVELLYRPYGAHQTQALSVTQRQRLLLLNTLCDPTRWMHQLHELDSSAWQAQEKWLDAGGVTLSMHNLLQKNNLECLLPTEMQSRWQSNVRNNRVRMQGIASEASSIHALFQRSHVRYATLKGFSLVPVSVPDMDLRYQVDLDFLVAEDDVLRAKEILEQRGYSLKAVSGRSWEFRSNERAILSWRDRYAPIGTQTVELHVEAKDAPNPLLTRIRWQPFHGVDMPVLHPADLYLGQGVHLYKHICSEFFRVSHLLEFRRHTLARHDDDIFWRDVRNAAGNKVRAVQGIGVAIALIESVTGACAPAALTSWTSDQSPRGVRRWISMYGTRAVTMDPPGSKLYLFLQRELDAIHVPSRRPVRQALLPRALPPVAIQRRDGEPLRETLQRYRLQRKIISIRGRFHLKEGLRYLYESWRWSRAAKHALLFVIATVICATASAQQPDSSPLLFSPTPTATDTTRSTQQQQQILTSPTGLQQSDPLGNQTGTNSSPFLPSSNMSATSARQIVTFLQANSDALIEVKQLMSDAATQAGQPVSPDSITDQALYTRIATNPEFRQNVVTFLQARGYLLDGEIAPEEILVPNGATSITGMTSQSQLRAPLQQPRRPEPTVELSREPRVLNRPTPYNLRSLHDLYTQVTDNNGTLKRFGAEMFLRRDTATVQAMNAPSSTELPAGDDYVLGPGDNVSLQISGSTVQTVTRTVDREGGLAIPEAGQVHVGGMTMKQARDVIAAMLKRQYRDVQVDLSLGKLRSVRVYVVGDVQRPGAYEVGALSSSLSALYAAGGPTAVGSLRILRHYRGELLVGEIDLYDFLLHGVQHNDRLVSGDTLLVPPAGPQVAVSGAVKRPAIYELKGRETLSTLLDDAGAATVTAELIHITIDRVQPNRQRETTDLQLPEKSTPELVHETLARFLVQDGDAIHISPIEAYSQRVIYTDGHVLRPGRIAWHDGMRLSDAIHSYRDMLPEPAERGEIIRLVPPDLHVETLEFSVPDAMVGNDNPLLQPFDTIRIRSRYEADAPKVTVDGEVLRPGSYSLSQGMTAAQLVRMAGGFTRSALTTEADLASYSIVSGTRVQDERVAVRIGEAVLKADATADVVLKAGDTLNVHKLTGWDDIGASIEVDGEVAHPGRYGFQQGERLSSVLRRAGGLRSTSYPDGAVYTRPDVKDLEEKSRQELIRQVETSSSAARTSSSVTSADGAAQLQLVQAQQDQILANLKSQPTTGRMVIHIGSDIASWENTPADIEVRTGDTLLIPKRPGFVLVSGQVYNSSAITFTPGKSAAWYLRRSGGATQVANTGDIFVIRANGSVVGRERGLFAHHTVLDTRLDPGDVVVVPQKIIGASLFWRNLLTVAQITSSIAVTAAIAGVL